MIYEPYWGLFWTTGMPEAWLMSRKRMGQLKDAAGPGEENTPAGIQSDSLDNVPGTPQGFT